MLSDASSRFLRRSLLTLAGLAAARCAWGADRRALVDPSVTDSPRNTTEPHVVARAHGLAALPSPDLASRFGAVSRGSDGAAGALHTMETGFESLPTLPASILNQLDTVTWGGASSSVTGRNFFANPTAGWTTPGYGVVSDDIAGNTSKKLRGYVDVGQGSPSPFFGRFARYDFFKTNSATPGQGARYIFGPTQTDDVRVSHETYLTSIDSLWTSEPTSVGSGFIVGRLLWGGQNATTGVGLPIGPITVFCALEIINFFGGIFTVCQTPAFYRSGAPFPGGAGQEASVPINSWFTITHEMSHNGTIRHVLDLHDGAGEFVIFEGIVNKSVMPRLDRMAWSGDRAVTGDAMYLDNVRIEGPQFCTGCPGDATNDCISNFADLNLVLSSFGATVPANTLGDLDGDGFVNFADLNIVLGAFGTEC